MIDLTLNLQKKRSKQKAFLIVEGIYSKTGNICSLPKLIDIRIKHKIRILIDETLSFGILGKNGRGITEHFNIPVRILVVLPVQKKIYFLNNDMILIT